MSGTGSGGTGKHCSPETRRTARLVTSSVSAGVDSIERDEQRRRGEELLEVVEDQQRARRHGGADVGAQGVLDRSALDAPQAERLRQHRRDVGGVGQRAEADVVNAAGEIGGRLRRDLQGQPRLAAASGAGQRQDAAPAAAQDGEEGGDVGVPADQRGARHRQGGGAGRAARWRERRGVARRRPGPHRDGGGRRRAGGVPEARQVAARRDVDGDPVGVALDRVVPAAAWRGAGGPGPGRWCRPVGRSPGRGRTPRRRSRIPSAHRPGPPGSRRRRRRAAGAGCAPSRRRRCRAPAARAPGPARRRRSPPHHLFSFHHRFLGTPCHRRPNAVSAWSR